METLDPPCLLLAADEAQRAFLRALLECRLVPGWELREAGSCAEALSLLQQAACHVLLADEGLCRAEGAHALARLASRAEVPVVLLTDPQPAPLVAALGQGIALSLPRELALAYPAVLGSALRQAVRWGRRGDAPPARPEAEGRGGAGP
jgi:DNA-binding NarL/FixJ family response regulator